MNKVERSQNPLITPDFKQNANTLKVNRSKYLEYSDFIKNAKRFAEEAMLNELKSICESYTELTGMNIEGIEIEFVETHCIGDARPVHILSNVKIINERI